MPACECGRSFEWATMRQTGKPMPYDPGPLPVAEVVPGTVAVRARDRLGVVMSEESAAKVRAQPASWQGWSFHTSHWESCERSSEFRANPNQERLEL